MSRQGGDLLVCRAGDCGRSLEEEERKETEPRREHGDYNRSEAWWTLTLTDASDLGKELELELELKEELV